MSNGPQRVERVTRGKIWIEFGLRAIQILSRPDIEIPLFPTNRSPIAIQPCAGSGGVPKVPSVRAKGGGEFAFSLVGHSKPTPTSQPAPLRLAACSPYKSQPSPHLGRQGALPEARGVSTTMCGGYGAPPRSHTPIHRPTRATTTPATHVGGELRCTLGNRVSQRLRDQGSGARVASWTRQPAIQGGQHATRATTTSPTHFGGGTAELSRKRTAVRVHVELPQNTSPQIATLLSFPPLTSPQIITAYHERTMVLCGHDNSRAAASCEQVQDWEPRSSRSSTRSSRETANAERSSA